MSLLISQTVNDLDGVLGDLTNEEYYRGNTFQYASDFVCSGIAITFRANSGSPSGQVTARIETTSGGLPTGTLADANATITFTPTASSNNILNFASSFNLSGNTVYALIFLHDVQSTDVGWNLGRSTNDEYANGNSLYKIDPSVPSWTAYTPSDLTFGIYGTIPNNYTKTFNEVMTISEVLTRGIGKNPLDTMTPSEVILRAMARIIPETATLTESIVKAAERILSENITLSEPAFVKGIGKNPTEDITLSETYSRQWSISRAWAETVTLTEVAAREISLFISEAVTLTEAYVKNWGTHLLFTEVITVTDTFTKGLKWLQTTHVSSAWTTITKALSNWLTTNKSTTTWHDKYG